MLKFTCAAMYLVLSCAAATQIKLVETDRCFAPASHSRLAYVVFWPVILPVTVATPTNC